jgi:tetratricopeptide (TPR) repeat protein
MNDTATGPWRDALGVIDGLLTASPPEREQKLRELEATQPDLHRRVRALLDADAVATRIGFLDVPGKDAPRRAGPGLAAGARLGPYRIERELGTGGMGEVWLARRDDGLYEGEVAIKTLHPFFAMGAMRDRFLREAQMLGKLAHPNIARLLDAGVADGVVFLVIEYVRGTSIEKYCDERSLDVDARLALFDAVCVAVAHAHANLVVHRDIKPGNILVTEEGQVKLLDFGIGKLLDAEGAEHAELTRVTGRVFTPEFAAPEQILGEAVTTATDVYSLGTLLFVLLAGARPFGNDVTGNKLEHAVLHEEPGSLSRAAHDAAPELAAKRGTTPARLAKTLAGDLENIVQRALRKPASDRYTSVQALADDIARFRRHEPVLARTGSRGYRMGRFVRRHRVAVAAAAGVFVAASAGVAGIVYQAREARAQAVLAHREAEKATSIKDYLLAIFEANSTTHPDGAEARKTTAEELMRIATKQVLESPGKDSEVRFELMGILGDIHAQLETFELQESLSKERIRLAEAEFGVADARLAHAYNDYSEFLRTRQRFDEAIAAANRAVELREAQGDHTSVTRGRSEFQLGQAKYSTFNGLTNEPVDHFLAAIRILEQHEPSPELRRSYLGLGRTYEYMDRYEEAIEANKHGIRLAEAIEGPRAVGTGGGHQQLSRALAWSYRLDEAELHLEKAIEIFTFASGPDGGFTMNAIVDLGQVRNRRGRFRESALLLEKAYENRVRVVGSQDRMTHSVRVTLLNALVNLGNFERAREIEGELVAGFGEKKNRRLILPTMRPRAVLAMEQGRAGDALKIVEEAQAHFVEDPRAPGPINYQMLLTRAETLAVLGRNSEAREALDAALPLLDQFDKDPEKGDRQYERIIRARVELADGGTDAAIERLTQVLDHVRGLKNRSEKWPIEDLALRRLADAQFAAGDVKAACASLDGSIALRTANALPIDPRLIAAKKLKARCTG